MAHVDASSSRHTYPGEVIRADDAANLSRHAHEAYGLLHVGFVIAPIVAGIDKFLHLLTNWDKYLAQQRVMRAMRLEALWNPNERLVIVRILPLRPSLRPLFRPVAT